MRRISILLTAVALLALMLATSAAPAMANNLFDDDNDHGLFCDDHDHGLFCDDDEDELRTIDVGNLECLVEDGDYVKFCVNEDTNEIVHHVF
jgi:hypothetical protein